MILVGDCLEVMRTLDANSVDAIVTDPPYGLGFMGKAWDHAVPGVPFWLEMLRVAKPGANVAAFGGTRTFHRMACAMEDAGWELRDTLMWVYGSGFPKSLDVSKAIDKANGKHDRDLSTFGAYVRQCREAKGWTLRQLDEAMGTNTSASWWEGRKSGVQPPGREMYRRLKSILGMSDDFDELIEWCEAQREVVGQARNWGVASASTPNAPNGEWDITAPATDASRQWEGWGTALKPAWEPIILARKPLMGTVAANVLAHGTGALNIDGCRVEGDTPTPFGRPSESDGYRMHKRPEDWAPSQLGRWPANVIHDGSEEVVAQFPDSASCDTPSSAKPTGEIFKSARHQGAIYPNERGSAARFFYCAKADRADRNDGCDGFEERPLLWSSGEQSPGTFQAEGTKRAATNNHPTVKPTDLMRWLCRLVTPPGGLILDPFTGSGSTGRGAILEGFLFTGIELDPNYAAIAEARIAAAVEQRRVETAQLSLFDNATMKEFADAA